MRITRSGKIVSEGIIYIETLRIIIYVQLKEIVCAAELTGAQTVVAKIVYKGFGGQDRITHLLADDAVMSCDRSVCRAGAAKEMGDIQGVVMKEKTESIIFCYRGDVGVFVFRIEFPAGMKTVEVVGGGCEMISQGEDGLHMLF